MLGDGDTSFFALMLGQTTGYYYLLLLFLIIIRIGCPYLPSFYVSENTFNSLLTSANRRPQWTKIILQKLPDYINTAINSLTSIYFCGWNSSLFRLCPRASSGGLCRASAQDGNSFFPPETSQIHFGSAAWKMMTALGPMLQSEDTYHLYFYHVLIQFWWQLLYWQYCFYVVCLSSAWIQTTQ